MKKKVQSQILLQSFAKALISASVLTALVVGCTKSRDAEIKDSDLDGEIIEIASIQGKEFSLQTGPVAPEGKPDSLKMVAGEEKASVKVASSTAPGKLASIFKNLTVRANEGQNYSVRMILDKSAMHVLKIVKDENELSTIEKQARIVEKNKGSLVPMFDLKVLDYGKICRVKDDNGDETSKLDLCHTDFDNASHVRLSLIKNDRSGYFKSDEMQEIFLANRIDGQVSELSDLKAQLNVALDPVEPGKVVSYVTPVEGSKVQILIYKILKKSDITDDKLLKKLNSNVKLGEIAYCPADLTKRLTADEAKDCVIVLSYAVDAEAVKAEVKTKDDFGDPTLAVQFKSAEAATNSSLIRIKAQTPTQTIQTTDVNHLNPYNTIRVVDLKGKEFLLRRTFEDSASPIQVFGPGASADLDIVKFEFEDERLVVRRATAVNGDKNPGTIDREELMSIPVKYFGIDPTSSSSVNPKLVSSTKDSAQYIVLDWTNNTLPVLNSPLAYFQDGQCFASTGNLSVTDLDNRIYDGSLNFSITGSYSFRPECMSWYGLNDYWYGGNMQGTFNIKERVSFKLHKGELDNKAMDLPFRAQNLMGFGVFTTGKIVPDDFGNSGHIANEVARPVIHDFSNGKQLVYHLGGLPAADEGGEQKWIRQMLIEGTQEVIQEWNDGLKQAFAGTSLERSTPYIVLKIDGVDGVEPGRLGDLDRNYIWNYAKNLDSGLLGMSQAGPNPRSGRIEQNNILMYSGNLLSNIGSYKEMARLQKEYEDMKKAALAEGLAQRSQSTATPEKPPVSPVDSTDPNGGLTIENGRRLIERMNTIASLQRPQTPVLLAPKAAKMKAGVNLISSAKNQIQGRGRSQDNSAQKSNLLNAQTSKMAYLEKIFRKAIEMNSTRDEMTLNALSAAEILKAYGKDMTQAQRDALAAQSRRLALMAEFNRNFSKGPNCAFTARPYTTVGEADPNLLDDSKTPEVFKSWYKSTLLHEMGHSLGLTHNFKGSKDKSNFKFLSDSKDMNRNYSSIMDYIPDSFLHYQGPGPYDIRTLRVAYTGMIELDPEAAKTLGGNLKIYKKLSKDFQNEITLADLKKAVLGDNGSWWNLDATFANKVPLKHYEYCSDVDAGVDPACNRWDMGTSNAEIAQFYADEYKSYYPMLNSRGTKIRARDLGSYLGRLQYEFFSIRPFLEELYYDLITGQDYMSTFQAALTARDLFAEVINTPSVELPYSSKQRFEVVDLPVFDEEGKVVQGKVNPTLVESKPSRDVLVPGMPDQIDTRGYELDKAFALMMLTQRDFGNPRYEPYSLRVSFADLESIMGAEPDQSITLITVANLLNDNPTGMVMSTQGLQSLPGTLKPEVTDLVRYYAGLSASIFLDADTIEDKSNFAALFRTASSQKSVPKDRYAVTKLDQSVSSPGALKLWALDNADYANTMVQDSALKRAYIDNAPKLVPLLAKAFASQAAKDQAGLTKARDEALKLLTAMNKGNLLITAAEAKAGVTVDKMFDVTLQFMAAQIQTANEVITSMRAQKIDDKIMAAILPKVLKKVAAETQSVQKQMPIFGLAGKALIAMFPADNTGPFTKVDPMLGTALAAYISPDVLETNYGMVVNNLQFLNQIMTVMHPELNRY